jgi:hypothetical protein
MEQGVAEAFIAPALSAANANAEFERTKTFVPRGYKGRVDTEVSGKEEYRSVMSALKKLAQSEGQHVECGLSGNKMSVFSKTMDSEALSDFLDMALQEFDQGVAEGVNVDSQIKRIKDRILQLKDWNTAGTHDKKIKELQARLKELQQQKQGVAEGSGQEPGEFEIYDLRTMKRVYHPFEANDIMDAFVKADDWLEAIGKSGRGLSVRPVRDQGVAEGRTK